MKEAREGETEREGKETAEKRRKRREEGDRKK